jgi:hypothetical protein
MIRNLLSLSLWLALLTASQAVDFYVAPEGNDAWSGKVARPNATRTDGPLATLTAARNAVRQYRAEAATRPPIRIVVANGQYTLAEPLVLEPQDSGTASAPITWEAAPGARPVFSGGRRITGFQVDAAGRWVATLPEVADGRWYFEQLFINDRRATRARTPNKFFFYLSNVRETALQGDNPRKAKQARQTVFLRPEDFATIGNLSPADLKDANLVVYHNWDNTRRFIDQVDPEQKAFITSGEGMKSWNPWKKNSHFIVENYRGALDAPGEWFLGRDGKLLYIPLPGENPATAEVYAPRVEKFAVLKGNPTGDQWVEHVNFRGLAFRHAQWLTPPGGFEPAQAAAPIEAVWQADGARAITIEGCELGHIGTYAAWFRKGCQNIRFVGNYVHDFGAGGVRIGEAGIAKDPREQTGRVVVDNNIIQQGGAIFPCGVGIWIGQSGTNEITHNDIGDLFYTGISAGWRWGYGESLAKGNLIGFNHVHHIGWGLLSDMGGIYTLGPSQGSRVFNNVFHDIYSFSYGGWGMYTDEGSTGIRFENNLAYNVKNGGFHQHYGRENVIRNNILAFSKLYQIQATRVEPHLSFTFENNLVYWEEGILLYGPWDKVRHEMRNNLYWKAGSDSQFDFKGMTLAQWQARTNDTGSVIADPLFVNATQRDFRLQPNSPALKLGFKPFDIQQAGVYGAPAWKQLAAARQYPALELPPEPTPVPLVETFEFDTPGRAPTQGKPHVENKGDSILVTSNTAAGGRLSLKITDAPGLKESYNPHFNYDVNLAQGTIVNQLDLRLETGAQLDFEWRDWSEGNYLTGPRFSIRGGKLRGPNNTTLTVPSNEWFRLSITAGLGAKFDGRWQLTVQPKGQPATTTPNLPFASTNFKKLTWVGFTSGATNTTAFYLDNFSLTPTGQ